MMLKVSHATTPHAALLWLYWVGEGALDAAVARNPRAEAEAFGVHPETLRQHSLRLREVGLAEYSRTKTWPGREAVEVYSPAEALTRLVEEQGLERRRRGASEASLKSPSLSVLARRLASLGLEDVLL